MKFRAIGLMSGTSLDGLDICYASFEKNKDWNYQILAVQTMPYPKIWEEKLRNAASLSAENLLELHAEYGFYLGEMVNAFIAKNSLSQIDLIASHGHTVFHQPHRKFSLQIGSGSAIKIATKLPVVYDFRSQDVLLGGHGAPLVPIGDEVLFSNFDACLNIGGFSNISFKENSKRIAFDICPVNIVLNIFAEKLGAKYDDKGQFASQGNIDEELLFQLNSVDFYQQQPPKSLGAEWVNAHILPKMQHCSPIDALATFTEHAAIQISNIFNKHSLKTVLFTGGGTYNDLLLEKISQKTTAHIIKPEKTLIDFKEALVFALMGVLRKNEEINVLSSATGSKYDHCGGILV